MSSGVVEVSVPAPAPARRSRRRLWISLAVALSLQKNNTNTTKTNKQQNTHTTTHKNTSKQKKNNTKHPHTTEAGPYTALIATARPGHVQSFYVMISNPSAVTQTILGLQYPGTDTAEPEEVAVARRGTSTLDDQQDYPSRRFTAEPTAIPPNGIRWLRISIHTARSGLWSPGRQEFWTDIGLRVRVGWFTRDETVSLGRTVFVLEGA